MLKLLGVQAKLSVGQADDVYEREADRIARQVMRVPGHALEPSAASSLPLRFPAHSVTPIVRLKRSVGEPSSCRSGGPATPNFLEDVERSLRQSKGSGDPLSAGQRRFFESRFGEDFGDVRVHADGSAKALNRVLNAQAFTHGSDIYLGDVRSTVASPEGKALLAHELTHVVQQRSAGTAAHANTLIQRFGGSFPWASGTHWYSAGSKYDINGTIAAIPGAAIVLSAPTSTFFVIAGTSGRLLLNLWGSYFGPAGSGVTASFAQGTFSLKNQIFPYTCTAEGVLTIVRDAIEGGYAVNDPDHMHPFGIGESEIGISFMANTDGSSFLTETITFAADGSGGASVGAYGVGIPVAAGTKRSFPVTVKINLTVAGARPASPAPMTPTATASATASVTTAIPAAVTVPEDHPIYFEKERQTEGDEGQLIRWVASLPRETQDAIRTGRLTVTVEGYASTTGSERSNMDVYSTRRAEWVRRIVARTLGIRADLVQVAPRGSATAPAEDRAMPGGVPNPLERRAVVRFAATSPTVPITVTSTTSSSAGASTK